MSKTFREASRLEWNPGLGGDMTNERIQIGCLQRIADATELMAKRYQALIDDRDFWKGAYREEVEISGTLRMSNNALRGYITKLKKAAKQ